MGTGRDEDNTGSLGRSLGQVACGPAGPQVQGPGRRMVAACARNSARNAWGI